MGKAYILLQWLIKIHIILEMKQDIYLLQTTKCNQLNKLIIELSLNSNIKLQLFRELDIMIRKT